MPRPGFADWFAIFPGGGPRWAAPPPLPAAAADVLSCDPPEPQAASVRSAAAPTAARPVLLDRGDVITLPAVPVVLPVISASSPDCAFACLPSGHVGDRSLVQRCSQQAGTSQPW